MMCPWAARIGARRSLRPASGVLTDPLQPPERLLRLSRAAPTLLAAPRTPARGRRLRSEGTETVPPPPKTALLPVVFFVGRMFPYLIAPVPSMLILILSSSLPTVPHPRVSSIFFIFGCPSRSGGKRDSPSPQKTEKRQTGREGVEPHEGEERGRAPEPNQDRSIEARRGEGTMAQLLRDLPARTGFLSRQHRGAANEEEEDRPPVALDGENDDAKEEVNQEEEDLERGWRGGGVVVGRLRRYVCDHGTDPPENQTLGNETQNILIRTLELRKRQERERAGAGKRKAPPSGGKSGSGSGSGNSGTKPGGSGSTPRSASKRPRRRAGRG